MQDLFEIFLILTKKSKLMNWEKHKDLLKNYV